MLDQAPLFHQNIQTNQYVLINRIYVLFYHITTKDATTAQK
ncbi:hypothetical protein MITSMUL_04862 [Mitsuokella multacida DSM 20544]|uniref:Uncharacterized protein n=1 Tax=Mitsuokella multacida DSM 20544 TaxID=500635 RepID=C9KN50_9FIRM|nr:hypothetical protein MITSMUL_04862 [Mitsuokella multacida DSM 20544]